MSKTMSAALLCAASLCAASLGMGSRAHAGGGAGPRTLIEGSPIQGANGLSVDAEGNLWVASVLGRRLVKVHPHSGRVLATRGRELGVETPDDTTFGPDGTQYFTSFYTGKVGAIAPDGRHFQVAQLPLGANPIAFTRDGTRLFVGLCFLGDALYEVDPTGSAAPRLIVQGIGAGCAANGMQFGADGLLYAPQTFTGQLIRVDVDTGEYEVLQNVGALFTGVAFHPKTGALYGVAGKSVLKLDVEHGTHSLVAELPHGLDNLEFDASGRLFVSCYPTGEVFEVSERGKTRALRADVLSLPQGLALDGESLYVASGALILEVDTRHGRVRRELPWPGFLTMGLRLGEGGLVAASPGDGLVVGFDTASAAVQFTRTDFAAPTDALQLSSGDLVVAEAGSGQVVRSPIDDVTVHDVLLSGLGQPAGLLQKDDDVFVSDFVAGKIYRVPTRGSAAASVVAEGLLGPTGLAFTPDGMLAVVEQSAGRVTLLDLLTGARESLPLALQTESDPLAVFPPSQFFHGIAVDRDGDIYVADSYADRVVVTRRRARR